MVSVCLPSDALLQHLPSYLGFSSLGRGISLHGCSSKVQPLLLTLDEGYLLTAALPDLQRGIAPLGPPAPSQPRLLGCRVAPPGRHPWPRTWYLFSAVPVPSQPGTLSRCPDLGHRVTPLGRRPSGLGSSQFLALTSDVGWLLSAVPKCTSRSRILKILDNCILSYTCHTNLCRSYYNFYSHIIDEEIDV